ncbi:MAG: arsenite methyltransferase [Chloroflexota bacterium]
MSTTSETLDARIRQRYADAALHAGEGACCGGGCCGSSSADAVSANLYRETETSLLPEEAVLASLGCGNPTALIDLHEGQTVLDLGSGGGIDVLLSASRVGPSGFVFGLDMTDEMLALAMANKSRAAVSNVAFLKGRVEDIPLPAASVDVVISNCVINLASDKSRVLRDAFRVLKPGGRFAVADVVSDGPIPDALRQNMEAWVGCIAGALDRETYGNLLLQAGFEKVEIEITRRYRVEDAGLDTSGLPDGWGAADGKIASAFVRATKPSIAQRLEPEGADLPETTDSAGCCDSGSRCQE